MLTPITKTPKPGDFLTLRIYSGAGVRRVEEYRVEVVEVFAAVCRVRLPSGGIVRAHVSQLFEI